MNLWIIGPSKSPQNVEAEHLEELNMKCPTRTSVSRSWNLKVDEVIDMTEILGSFSQPTKHKRCGSTFRLVVAWPRLVFFWGEGWCKTESQMVFNKQNKCAAVLFAGLKLGPKLAVWVSEIADFLQKKMEKKKTWRGFLPNFKTMPQVLGRMNCHSRLVVNGLQQLDIRNPTRGH